MTQLRRLKHVADVRFSSVDKKTVDGQIDVKLCNYTDVYYNERILADMPFMDATATPDQVAAFTLKGGDVLLTKDSETADDIGVSSYVPDDLPGVLCGYHLAIARPHPSAIDGRYLRWALVSTASRQQLEVAASGVTRFGLRQDAVGGMPIPTPPLREQAAIADYLDAATARIDALVANRRRQVRLLDVRRSGVVVHLATGSDAGAVPTEGHPRFPNGWARTRLRFLVQPPQSGDWGDDPTGVDDTLVVRAADFDRKGWRVDPARLPLRAVERQSILRRRLRAGDLVLEKSGGGPDQPVGVTVSFELDVSAVPSNFAARLRPADGIDPRFLCYALAATYELGLNQRSIKQTTGIQNLDMGAYLSEEWAVPPYAEQVRIRAEIDAQLAAIDALQAASERQIDLLLERRQALITAAVTGHLDIHGTAA